MAEDLTFFSSVDRTNEPGFFLRLLDEANKLPEAIAFKPIILSGLKGGERVLDLGCGLGNDTFEIARLVGTQGRAVGVDVSENMIIEARRRAEQRRIDVEFEVGDAQALRFGDATFDACRSERMLMHVQTPSALSRKWCAWSVLAVGFPSWISTGRRNSSIVRIRKQPT
jgi:2-polyprenyl-3-methyl-5-hydroxy-6-metoxy-1,4-benzoquinol methylase